MRTKEVYDALKKYQDEHVFDYDSWKNIESALSWLMISSPRFPNDSCEYYIRPDNEIIIYTPYKSKVFRKEDTTMVPRPKDYTDYSTSSSFTCTLNSWWDANKWIQKIFSPEKSIKKVIFNDPATIVLWEDDTKTIVKCNKGDTFDPEKGLAMAICKKIFGNKGNYYNEFKRWIPESVEEIENDE